MITKIYPHFSFEQERFKRNSFTNGPTLEKKMQKPLSKNIFKLLNNVGFGYDCSNNSDNCKFILIFDQLKEITYLKT